MSKLKILVVDDKKIIGDFFDFTLGFSGHDIKWVNNGFEAVEAIKNEPVKFDIVFLDIVIPHKDGVAILKEIKSADADLPVVMMSGYSVEEKRDQAQELGAVTCLNKPFEMDDVRKVVKATIGRDI